MTRTYSAEYKRLQPYVVEEIRKVVNALGVGGSGTGSGTVAKHAIAGDRHTGELAQTQAPWSATKVELSNHAALPDAHHAKLHGITDAANHSVTGSQYQIVGLTAVNTLGLLTPSASPAANAVVKTDSSSAVTLVDLTVTSDLFLTGYLDFGTDVMYEDASYLQVTGSKAVRFGQNIGNGNWTIYNNGQADFGASVNIAAGGDLTVNGSGSYAGNKVLFASSAGGNVGIMRVPDSQFALDIAGPCRAEWFIGPHAIQLKGVLLLAHYDGRAPYATNFSGEPNGHMGQVATVGGGLIFRPGKFYKAAQLSHATTNLMPNPSFEVDTSGWAFFDTGTAGSGSMTRVATMAYTGGYSLQLVNTASGQDDYASCSISGVSANTAYTISAYAYVTDWVAAANANRGLFAYDSSNAGTTQQTTTITGSTNGAWVRHSVTITTTATPGSITVRLYSPRARVFWDAIQVEQRNFVTPYCDGSLGDGHAWTGTAHASTSTRTAATLAYPTSGNINAAAGTIMAWVWVDANDGSTNTEGIVDAGTAWPYFAFYMSSGTVPYAIVGNASGTVGAAGPAASGVQQWVHVAMVWTGSTLTVYTNGQAGTSVSYTNAPALHTAICVGFLATLGNRQLNGYIDDFCILDRAISDKEIRAVYESNAPVFAESSVFTFRPTPKGLIWADDEGLWARDTAGKSVLGVYGGEAASKPWGGFNLAPGDILLGNNAVSSSAILWSRGNGTFGFYGAGSGTPQVEIATDGRLTAGAGKIALDSTGFHAFNASAVATIDINADGIYLGDGGARTTIATWTSGNRIRAYNVGEVYEATPETYLDDSSVTRTLYPLVVRAIRQGNDAALVEISAVNTSNVGAFLRVGEGFRLKDYYGTPYNTNRVVHASATDIILECTNLQLVGLTTNTTQSTGTGTLKMAGTTSRNNTGFVRVTIGGTVAYIPYFTTITG